MDIHYLVAADIRLKLPDCLEKRQAQYHPPSPDFGNDHIGPGDLGYFDNPVFNLIGNMRITWTVAPKYSPCLSLLITAQ